MGDADTFTVHDQRIGTFRIIGRNDFLNLIQGEVCPQDAAHIAGIIKFREINGAGCNAIGRAEK